MKVFITGATGYIGANLALKLANGGHLVHALVRSREKAKEIEHPNIRHFLGDLSEPAKINNAMEGCEAVFHLAAYARVWAKDPQTYFDINVEGTKNVLDATLSNNIKKFIYTSTAGVLGPSYNQPIDESSVRKIDFFNEYESSKILAENLVLEYLSKGLKPVILYPPRVYGPGIQSDSNAVSLLIERYMEGKWRLIPGDGRKTGCYAFIEDITDGHIRALQHATPGSKYILGGENASYIQLFDLIKKYSGKNYSLIKVPLPAMKAFGYIQLVKNAITGKPPLLTPKWIDKYQFDWSLSSKKAEEELGYRITPLEEGVKKTIAWIKNR